MSPVPTLYVFADEAGNFDFSNAGSEYFTVCAVTMRSLEVGHRLLDLRHELALEGLDVRDDGRHIQGFHATEDKQYVRDRVFPLIRAATLDIDAIVLHKRKAYVRVRQDDYFYQLAWHLLFRHMAPRICRYDDHLLVAAATLGTRGKRQLFDRALSSVIWQHNLCRSRATRSWDAVTHPCLQIADYCTWAIHRSAERGDRRSFDLIEPQVRSCFFPFSVSTQEYY